MIDHLHRAVPAHASRREFLSIGAVGLLSLSFTQPGDAMTRKRLFRRRGPAVHTAKRGNPAVIVGEKAHRYEVQHDWPQLPDNFSWQTTHNVAVDQSGNLYVIHEGDRKLADHPSIFVFDPEGKYIRSFGSEFQGGGHGLEIRREPDGEFLYVTGYQHLKNFAKYDLQGERVWMQRAPMESGIYADGEHQATTGRWGRDRFMPTNFAFLPDGGFMLADGYGTFTIHRYDADGKWISTFGSPGKADGQFNLPHGLWLDDRQEEPLVVVADRVNGRLQWFDLHGMHKKTLDGFILPANCDVHGDTLLVPDLSARITLLDKENQPLAQLGDDSEWRKAVLKDGMALRTKPDEWQTGRFLHPHDACFDRDGNIFVAEWVAPGRVTRLVKQS